MTVEAQEVVQESAEPESFGIFEEPAAPAESATPAKADAAEPAKADGDAQEEARVSAKWSDVLRQQREVVAKRQELEQKQAELDEIRGLAKKDPIGALDKLGYKLGDEPPSEAEQAKKTLEEMRAELAAVKAEIAREREQSQVAQFVAAVSSNAAKTPLVARLARENPKAVAEQVAEQMNSGAPSFEAALERVEQAQRGLFTGAVQALADAIGKETLLSVLGVATEQPKPKPPKESAPSSLTGKSLAAAPVRESHEMTEDELEAFVIKQMRERNRVTASDEE